MPSRRQEGDVSICRGSSSAVVFFWVIFFLAMQGEARHVTPQQGFYFFPLAPPPATDAGPFVQEGEKKKERTRIERCVDGVRIMRWREEDERRCGGEDER